MSLHFYVNVYICLQECVFLCVCTILLVLLLFLQLVVLLQVDVGRLHSDDGFVQKTEGFLHMFGLHLKTKRKTNIRM